MFIRTLAKRNPGRRGDAHRWVAAPYTPLPALTEAARLIFEHQPLPQIKRAESEKIPEALAFLEEMIRETGARGGRLLALVAGVPGSGKTLLGLQLAYSRRLRAPAIFLSGNRPLVQVLKYTLGRGAHAFVQDMHAFLKQHAGSGGAPPPERLVVFDEAQRAWDRDRVLDRHKGRLTASEPELLAQIGNRVVDGFALVALIGEGQEIHAGEESGIGQWVDAVQATSDWTVIGPSHLAGPFRAAGIAYQEEALLSLTTSLRSHRAADVALWAGLLLDGRLDDAHHIAESLKQAGFVLRAGRDFESLRDYVRGRYEGEPSKRFGVIVSSKFPEARDWGIRIPHRYWYYGPWFQAPPSDPHSGSHLEVALTEFGCQGLELDLPLVCWGPDCRWDGSAWLTRPGRNRHIRDPRRLRLNAYRVLLTRGRDGVTVFVPPKSQMDSTFSALCRAGFDPFG